WCGVLRDRSVFVGWSARLVVRFERSAVNSKRRNQMELSKKTVVRTLAAVLVVAAISAGAFAVGAFAQAPPVKIGLLAMLEGPFAAGGQDGIRGAELAVRQRNGVVAGRTIELVTASSDAKPD